MKIAHSYIRLVSQCDAMEFTQIVLLNRATTQEDLLNKAMLDDTIFNDMRHRECGNISARMPSTKVSDQTIGQWLRPHIFQSEHSAKTAAATLVYDGRWCMPHAAQTNSIMFCCVVCSTSARVWIFWLNRLWNYCAVEHSVCFNWTSNERMTRKSHTENIALHCILLHI